MELWLVRREALPPSPPFNKATSAALTLSAALELEPESASSQLRPSSVQHFPFHFLNSVHIAFCSFFGTQQQVSCATTEVH
jgi:hypothetical protein